MPSQRDTDPHPDGLPISDFPELPEDVLCYTPHHIAAACGVNEDTVTRVLNSRLGHRLFEKDFGRWVWYSRLDATLVCIFVSTQSPKARTWQKENFGKDSDTVRSLRAHLRQRLQSK